MSEADDIGADTAPDRPSSSKTSSSWLLGLLLLAVVVILFVRFRSQPSGNREIEDEGLHHPGVGAPLEGLYLTPLVGTEDGIEVDSPRGKVLLVNYWGTWCPPCRIEFPHMVTLHARFREHPDFQFASVSCLPQLRGDASNLAADTESFLVRSDASFPVYADLDGRSRWSLVRSAKMEDFVFPTTVIVDRSGIIRGLWEGYAPGYERGMERLIEELLADDTVARTVQRVQHVASSSGRE